MKYFVPFFLGLVLSFASFQASESIALAAENVVSEDGKTLNRVDSTATSLVISKSVEQISPDAFLNCPSLESIAVEKENSTFFAVDGVLFNKKKTKLVYYPSRKKGKSYKVMKSVTAIGKYAFLFNSNIKSVTLPSSVTSIEPYAFYMSSANVNIPKKVKSIGAYAFAYSGMKEASFPSTFTTIGKYAFSGCPVLTSVDLSKSKVKTLSEGAFSSNGALTSVKFNSNLEYIKTYAFSDSGISDVTVPASVKEVGDAAFYSTNLKTFTVMGKDTVLLNPVNEDKELYDWNTDSYYPNPLVIKAPAGSTAQKYAEEYELNFVAI